MANLTKPSTTVEGKTRYGCGAQHSNSHLLNMAPPEKDFPWHTLFFHLRFSQRDRMANLTKPSTTAEGKKIYAKDTNQYPQRVLQGLCFYLDQF
jgi:hypothetical protein